MENNAKNVTLTLPAMCRWVILFIDSQSCLWKYTSSNNAVLEDGKANWSFWFKHAWAQYGLPRASVPKVFKGANSSLTLLSEIGPGMATVMILQPQVACNKILTVSEVCDLRPPTNQLKCSRKWYTDKHNAGTKPKQRDGLQLTVELKRVKKYVLAMYKRDNLQRGLCWCTAIFLSFYFLL